MLSQVACGSTFTLALTSEAEVYSWGSTSSLGHGRKRGIECGIFISCITMPMLFLKFMSLSFSLDGTEPRRVAALTGAAVSAIFAGGGHCMALTLSGDAFSWGRNTKGQAGVPLNDNGNDFSQIWAPIRVPLSEPIRFAALGDQHSLLLSSTGQLYGFDGAQF